ncbi:transposase [Deinococcus psychrotolerans]|uniref:transposase n=1 Tax=Deinococcus psychrotolerans TaxID=2489213 RepID=UPI0013DE3131|nr:transposase [Deinococcus psychrotolerans]
MTLWLVLPGRHNFTNLARYGPISDRTHRSWAQKPVPWVQLNSTLVLQAQDQQTLRCGGILGVDAVFIPKYGNHTPDLASYWSGCQGQSVRGLEGTCVTWIDPATHQPIPLSITQTPATLPVGQSRVDFYATVTLNTIAQLPDQLKKQVQAVVGDAYYAKLNFVARVVDEGQLPFIGKMRKDANLKHLFTGPRTGKPGRPRQYDGKVSLCDFSRWDAIPWADESMVYTVVAYSVSLKRQVRVVTVVWPGSSSRRMEVLFSTSTTMTAATIIALYRARFSMEFPFRDAKQFAGLSGCQSRQVEALHSHWNMALMAVSATRLSQLKHQRASPLVFSMEDEKRRAYNAFFAERILSILTQEQTEQKCEDLLADLLSLGVKAA